MHKTEGVQHTNLMCIAPQARAGKTRHCMPETKTLLRRQQRGCRHGTPEASSPMQPPDWNIHRSALCRTQRGAVPNQAWPTTGSPGLRLLCAVVDPSGARLDRSSRGQGARHVSAMTEDAPRRAASRSWRAGCAPSPPLSPALACASRGVHLHRFRAPPRDRARP